MIERYTIKFAHAVSQKELEKALNKSGDTPSQVPDIRKIKARIEFLGDFDDVKKISDILKELAKK